ncbi:HAD family phosphatase [Desulfatiferula olefinivorans]
MNEPTLIFDLGGVFIELTGVSQMREWTGHRLSVDELWSIWLHSEAVRRFESGLLDPRSFAQGVIDDYALSIDIDVFLDHFSSWSNHLFPGSRRLLSALSERYTLASLSNTNAIHWTNLCERFGIDRYFHHNFPSHQIGRVKPAIDTFTYVIDQLDSPAEQIFFFDDHPDNIASARQAGLNAHQVVGLDDLNRTLSSLSLI